MRARSNPRFQRLSAALAVVCLLAVAAPALAVSRDEEPVVVLAASVPELFGESVADFGLFRYDTGSSSFVAIPYQVDERLFETFVSEIEAVPDFTENMYDVFNNDDGLLDSMDEIAFLFGDAGPQAPPATTWPTGADSRRYEVRLVDPRPTNPEPDRYVYIFTGAGLAQSATTYVTWDQTRNGSVTTSNFAVDYTDKWLLDGYRVLACGSGADLIDRVKVRAGNAPDNGETEEFWNISATYLGAGPPSNRKGIVGPIRAIRYVRGAGSGANTTHHDVVYTRTWERNVKVRVHPLNNIWHYIDWLPQPGATLYSQNQPAGMAVDGLPDVPVDTPAEDWNLFRGPGGGMMFIYNILPSPFFQALTSYLRDDSTYNDDTGLPNPYTDDDDSAYGNHGFHMDGLVGQDEDVIEIDLKFWSLCQDTGDANLAAEYQELEDFPIAQTPTAERDNTLTVDLAVTKTVDNATPMVGDNVVFTTSVSNAAGVDTATGVRVLDLLPTGFAYVSDDSGGGYNAGAGIWDVGTLAPGAGATLNVTARVRGTGDHLNEAEVVTADQDDLDDVYGDGAGEDHDTATVTPTAAVDLSLTKVVNDPTPAPGAQVNFSITTVNDPDFSHATGVTVTDLLPSGFTYVVDDSTLTGTTYNPLNGLWTIGNLDAGDSITLNITATVNPAGNYTNVAEVSGSDLPDYDSTPGNNVPAEDDQDSATVTPTGGGSADLSVTKTVDNATPNVQTDVVFTVTVSNAGPDTADNVEVTDLLPSGYTYVSDDSGGAYDSGTGVWTVGTVANGGSATLNITATVLGTGLYDNVAELTGSSLGDPDSTPSNGIPSEDDQDSATTTPIPIIDLSLVKTVDNATPNVGSTVTFTNTVNNAAGFSPASGVQVTDALPGGYTYVSDDSGGAYDPGTGLWTVGPVSSGGSAFLKITARVEPAGNYQNESEITAANETDVDSVPGNNQPLEDDQDTAATTPVATVDLTLTKTVDNPTPPIGGNVVFTVDVSNAAAFSDASGLQVTDLLPSGYAYVSDDSASSGTSYNPTTGLWTIGALVSGNSVALNITATVNPAGDYTNVAEVTAADQPDADDVYDNGAGNDHDTATTTPTGGAQADLSLTKTVDNPTPDVGSNVVFTVTVSNAGPDDATGVEVTDLLPAGYTYVSDDSGGAYDSVSGLWTVGTVTSPGSATLNITATVNANGSYDNVAEVTASDVGDPDSTPGNGVAAEDDQDNASTTPNAVADLSLTKTVDNATPDAGSDVVFTITVSNTGPSDGSGIVVTDLLPAGYAYVSDDSGGSYDPGTGAWNVGGVANGANAVLNVTATVRGTGDHDNVAEVTAAGESDPDSTPGNGIAAEDDQDSAATTPNPRIDLSLTKTVDNPTPTVGTDIVFSVTVSNDAVFSDASGVAVTDLLPGGYTYVSDDSGGTYDSVSGIWTVGTVAAGTSVPLNITATVNPSGDYDNVAEITAATEPDVDSTPNNGIPAEDDQDNASTTPTFGDSDLSLVKTVDNPTPDVGSNVVFTVTVSNAGPDEATGVEVTDLLPAGYAYVSDDSGGSYNAVNGVWTVGTLASLGNATLNITASVNPGGSYDNVAEVTAVDQDDPDSMPGNGIPTEDDQDNAVTTPNPVADLSLTKTVDNATPDVGSNVVFTLTVSNDGPSDGTGIVVGDPLPGGYLYVSDDSGGSYNPGTGGWDVGGLADTASATLNITATVLGSGGYDNVAEVIAAGESDPDSTPNNGMAAEDDQDNAITTPNPRIDLSVTKVVDNPTPNVGGTVVFTVTVANASGFSDATGVVVRDRLPNGYSYVSDDSASTGTSYNPGNGRWTVGTLTGGASLPLHITATVNPSGNYDNVAEVTSAGETDIDSTPNNNDPAEDDQDNASTTPVGAEADLSLTKTVDQGSPDVGSNVVFTITVSNGGPADASGVEVTDQLPSGYLYVSDDGGGAYNQANGRWDIGNLGNGANTQLNITATVRGTGDHDNVAEVTASNETDPDSTPGNGVPAEDDQDNAATTPNPVIDLSLTKTVDNATPDVGQNVVFTVTVDNDPDFSDASGVSVTDLLPGGYTYVSDDGGGTYDSGTGVWTVGAVAAGASSSLNITATVNASGDYDNVAEVTAAGEPDADSTPNNGIAAEDDQDNAATTPNPVADLSLTKTVDNPTPNVGSNVVFTVTVSNAGPSDATGVQVSDPLPSGYMYVSDDSGGTYDSGTGLWDIGGLTNGNNAVLNITASVNATGDYDNVAEVSAANESDPDSTPGNGIPAEDDQDNASTTPVGGAEADLRLTKTVDNATPDVGSSVVFTITVTNDGPDGASGVVVQDALPTGYTYVSDDSGGNYDSGTGAWTVGSLALSASATLNITASVDASGDYDNVAEVSASDQPDPDSTPGNGIPAEDDQDNATTTPIPIADLSLSKTVDNPTPPVGSDVVFTVTVQNDGPSAATGVQVTDLLPNGYTYQSDDSGGAYDSGTGVWTVGGIAGAGSATLNITATVNASGDYDNVAEVTAAAESDPDSTPGNGIPAEDDQDNASTTPDPGGGGTIDLSLTKTVDNVAPAVGKNVVFSIDVSNAAGSDGASGVEVTDLLPGGYLYVSDAPSQGSYDAGTGIWSVGALGAGASASLDITAFVRGSGDWTNEAEVTAADQPDLDDTFGDGMGADHDTASVTPTAAVDLRLDKVVDNLGPATNENVVFTIVVSNDEHFSDATGLIVTDKLPDGYLYVSDDAAVSGTTYNPNNGEWDVGTLTAGVGVTLNITAKVRPGNNYVNVAEVTAANEPDTDDVYGDGQGEDHDTAETTPNSIRTLTAWREGDDVVLDWQPLSGAETYRIYLSSDPSAPKSNWVLLDEVVGTEYRDSGAALSSPPRYYSVTAFSLLGGEGPH